MKTLFFLLLFAASSFAQSVKWHAPIPANDQPFTSCAYSVHPDGNGGCVLFLEYALSPQNNQYRLVWITRKGKVLVQDVWRQTVLDVEMYRVAGGTATVILRNTDPAYSTTKLWAYRLTVPKKPVPEGHAVLTRTERELAENEALSPADPAPDTRGYFTLKNDESGQPTTIARIKNLK